jgi:hypothetical protein
MRIQKSVAIVGIGALVVIGTGSAVAATGHNLILGAKNTATKTTTLSDSKGTPLSLGAPKGKPPLQVNSSTEVKKLNAALLDGLPASALERKITANCAAGAAVRAISGTSLTCTAVAAPIAHVINVSAGATAAAGGANLKAVIAAITDASATNGYLVNVGPGVYDLGTSSLAVPAHVDLAGSGVDLTTITSSVDGGNSVAPAAPTGAAVDLSADTTLRDLAVTNQVAGAVSDFQVGVLSTGAGGPVTVEDVDVSVLGANDGVGLAAEVGSTMLARDVKATVGGIDFAEGGRADTASILTVTGSTFALASAGTVYSAGVNEASTVKLANTQMPSAASFNDGSAGATVTCFGDYTAALAAATC